MSRKLIKIIVLFIVIFNSVIVLAQEQAGPSDQAKEAYNKPNYLEPKELFERAKQCLENGNLDDARLYSLRLYFDGNRNINLLNMLGMIEIQAGRPLLGAEWLRKACALSLTNKTAQRYLPRLPQKPRPIPVDPAKLTEHFTEITESLPKLIEKLSNEKLHFEAVMKALERGQMYLALALAEEYEKRYPQTADGYGLSALCAWYLGRNADALKVIEDNSKNAPYNSLLLFVKAMINDYHAATFGGNYFRALYDFDQWEKALGLVEQYSKQYPNSADGYITGARILLDLHKTKEAGEALQEAGKRDPGNPEIELLWVNYMIQRNDKDKAARRLANAYKRGYNMPSVNLTAGIFAIQDGRLDDVNIILDEATSCLPFSDPEAYPVYISIVLTLDRLSEARKALNLWKPRSGEKSMYCYMEAYYAFKSNHIKDAFEWLRKGFKMNPNRIDVLRFFIALPVLEQEDKNLYAQINNKLSEFSQGFISMKVPERIIPKQENKKEVAPGITDSGAPVILGNFKISLGANIDESGRAMILGELNEMYTRIASRIGGIKEPVNVRFVSAENLGPMIARYDSAKDLITVTSNYYDKDMIRNIILANFDAFTEEEITSVIEEYPKHLLASALGKYMIDHIYPNAKNADSKNYWMKAGLSEILAGSRYTLRYRLLVAQKSIENQMAKLSSINMLNSIFTEGYTTPAINETATAQSYLMTSYLVKKSGGLGKGCKQMMNLISKTSDGADVDSSIKEVFSVTSSDFDKGWREAASWAMQQGAPYEW